MAKDDALLRVTHPSVILPAAGAVWASAAVMHAAHVSWHDPAIGTAVVASLAYGRHMRPLARATLAAGTWVTAATAYGPLAGEWHLLTWTWAATAVAALIGARYHPAVRDAREHRASRRHWLHQAARYRMHGSHLLEHETTRLGDRRVFDTTGTGRLASQIAGSHLAEMIAQDDDLPLSRVQVRVPRPGRVEISRRFRDPWKHPILHPVLDDDPELPLPVPCTVREPLPVGQDPETGEPLNIVVWDEDGAKVIQVIAKRRAGKTTLLSSARERVTAAADAQLWNVNLSKSVEDREWARACHRSACGPGERKAAFRILRDACQIIDQRGATPRDTPVFQPTPEDALIVLVIDEIDALVAANPAFVRAKLAYIASKAGSEGVALIFAGQRATVAWIGGGDVKANIDYVVLGKVRSPGEVQHALGPAGLMLPAMAEYGEGRPGVWLIADDSGDYEAGRAFNLRELTDIRYLASERAVAQVSVPVFTGGPPIQPEEPSGIGHLDLDLEGGLPEDLRDTLARLDAKNADSHRLLDQAAETIERAPQIDPAKLAESTAQRWQQVAAQAPLPDDAREQILVLLAGEGTTISKAAEVLGVSKWTMRCWLEGLRLDGTAEIAGKGRGARWRLVTATESDDG